MPIVHVTQQDLEWSQFVVFVRGDGLLDEKLAQLCHKGGRTVIYILDDDLLNVPEYLGSGPFYAQQSVKKHIRTMIELADCFASPSEKLLGMYGLPPKQSFSIIEPSVCRIGKKPAHPDGRLRIGFAGSTDRATDIDKLITQALREIMARYADRISIEFFGVQTDIAKELGCRTYPYTESYEDYQRQMIELNWDIGLAPMPETHFHSCKHYNKLVEYCSFGIVGVYSNVLPYTAGVEDGVTGLLCENTTQAWVEALSRLIEDRQLRERLRDNCLEKARTDFSIETAARKLLSDLESISIPEGQHFRIGSLSWIKFTGMVSWFIEKYKKYGWKTPAVAVKKLAGLLKKGGREA